MGQSRTVFCTFYSQSTSNRMAERTPFQVIQCPSSLRVRRTPEVPASRNSGTLILASPLVSPTSVPRSRGASKYHLRIQVHCSKLLCSGCLLQVRHLLKSPSTQDTWPETGMHGSMRKIHRQWSSISRTAKATEDDGS